MRILILVFTMLIGYAQFAFSNKLKLSDNPIIIERIDQVQETCDLSNGSLSIFIQGNTAGLLYSIDAGTTFQESNQFDNLDSGDYLIVVSNGSACTEIYTAQIADAPLPEIQMMSDCNEGVNYVDVFTTFFNGIPPYEFNWEGPSNFKSTEERLEGVTPGMYFVTITDKLGCSISNNLEIEDCCKLNLTCNLTDTNVACLNQVPEKDEIYQDMNASNDAVIATLMSDGVLVDEGACNNISVLISDSNNDPTDCENDKLIIDRTYTITDGQTEVSCSRKITVDSYSELLITVPANDKLVNCISDVELEFNEWLANYGGSEVSTCSEPVTITTIPETPEINYSCIGTGEIEVIFVFEDGCGNVNRTSSTFTVLDDLAPAITCPESIEFINTDPNINLELENWLTSATASDDCTQNLTPAAKYELDLTQPCELLGSYEVEFIVIDDCGNENQCLSTIEIVEDLNTLICPDNIRLLCGGEGNVEAIANWLESATSTNSNASSIQNDLNPNINLIGCDALIEVNFFALNNCNTETSCLANISIIDELAPEITCPETLTIEIHNPDNENIVDNWLQSSSAIDCNTYELSNNYNFDLASAECSESVIVEFRAKDICDLESNCSAEIVITNDNVVSITCPEQLEISCTDPLYEQLVEEHLDLITVSSLDDYELELEYDDSVLSPDCFNPQTFEISSQVKDICGNVTECRTYIKTAPDPILFVPNIFNPTSSGNNGSFTAYGNDSVDFIETLVVFNRWGVKVFEASDIEKGVAEQGWDGTYKSKSDRTEVFTYHVIARDTAGEKMEKTGTVLRFK